MYWLLFQELYPDFCIKRFHFAEATVSSGESNLVKPLALHPLTPECFNKLIITVNYLKQWCITVLQREFLPKPKDLKTSKYVNEQSDPQNPHTAHKYP